MPTATTPATASASATDFTVYYSGYSTDFKYNSDKKCYNAFIDGDEYIDGGNNSSIDFANVIVLNIPSKSVDSYGRQAMEDRADNFYYSLKDGTPLNLSIGKTFISIAPLDSTDGLVFNK